MAVAGLDEAGRGPWAGPVYAAAVIFPAGLDASKLHGLTDSKLLTRTARDRWFEVIKSLAAGFGISKTEAEEIDRIGIVPATKRAMLLAISQLASCSHILCDAMSFNPIDFLLLPPAQQAEVSHLINHQKSYVRGEQISLSIAAASVLAKVSRDREMCQLDERYPRYGFSRHKGYGTREHQQTLLRYGPCPLHRVSFKPIKQLLEVGL